MKKIELGQAITILANIGVIVGIAFLAVEVSQNNDELAAQTRNRMFELRADIELDYIRNVGGIADIYNKMNTAQELTRIEGNRIASRRMHALRSLDFMYREDPQGTLQEADFWIVMFQSDPGLLEYWDSTKEARDPELVRLFEQVVIPAVRN